MNINKNINKTITSKQYQPARRSRGLKLLKFFPIESHIKIQNHELITLKDFVRPNIIENAKVNETAI